jgi:hypothetical protein
MTALIILAGVEAGVILWLWSRSSYYKNDRDEWYDYYNDLANIKMHKDRQIKTLIRIIKKMKEGKNETI